MDLQTLAELAETVAKCAVLLGALLTGFAYATWFERRTIARMQARLGPNRAGPAGLLLPAADGLKLAFKENIMPDGVERAVYLMAPLVGLTVAVLAFAVVPIGDPIAVPWGDGELTLQVADFSVALLFILGVTSFAVYGIALAGWSSNNKYALLGGLRSSAQMISYELSMGLSLLGVVLLAGSLSMTEIVDQQRGLWFVLLQPLGFLIYAITAVAETNRPPFDMPEAEQELIAGYHIEYTGLRFALFTMGEYIAMISVCAIAVSVYLGGYRLPGLELPWYLDIAVFLAKVAFCIFILVWIRATVPRLRYDQLMSFGWKLLLPLAILNLVLTALGVYIWRHGLG